MNFDYKESVIACQSTVVIPEQKDPILELLFDRMIEYSANHRKLYNSILTESTATKAQYIIMFRKFFFQVQNNEY